MQPLSVEKEQLYQVELGHESLVLYFRLFTLQSGICRFKSQNWWFYNLCRFFCLCEENMDCDTCEQVGSNFLFKEKTLDTNMFKLKLPVRTVITHHLPQKAQGSFVQTPPPKKNASAKWNYKCKYKEIMESVLLSICVALLFKFQLISARWCRPRRNVWSLWQRTTWRGVNRSWSSCGETITARGLTLFFLRLHKHHRTETTWWKSCNLQEMTLLQQV